MVLSATEEVSLTCLALDIDPDEAMGVWLENGSGQFNLHEFGSMAEKFLNSHAFFNALAEPGKTTVTKFLFDFPVAVFGSPPADWSSLIKITGSGSVMTIFGYAMADSRPLLMVSTAAGCFLVWFGSPVARIVREGAAERVARRLKVELREEHLK